MMKSLCLISLSLTDVLPSTLEEALGVLGVVLSCYAAASMSNTHCLKSLAVGDINPALSVVRNIP